MIFFFQSDKMPLFPANFSILLMMKSSITLNNFRGCVSCRTTEGRAQINVSIRIKGHGFSKPKIGQQQFVVLIQKKVFTFQIPAMKIMSCTQILMISSGHICHQHCSMLAKWTESEACHRKISGLSLVTLLAAWLSGNGDYS